MTTPRTYYVLGGRCSKGHLLTYETAYITPYTAKYRHHKRPPGPRIRCVVCVAEWKRKRHNQKSKTRVDPDALHTCSCGTTMVRRDFGIHRYNKDGTPYYHPECQTCRNERTARSARERRAEKRERQREERIDLTRWLISQAWRLKRECGVPLAATRERLDVSLNTWSNWKTGRQLPELARLSGMIATMQEWIAAHHVPVIAVEEETEPVTNIEARRAHKMALEERQRAA